MQITTQTLPVLLLVVLPFMVFQTHALAKAKVKAPPRPKLVKLTPIFDTTGVPKHSPFKLEIKHTQYIFPEDPATLLHGNGRIVDLRASKADIALRGRVTETQHESTMNTRQYGVKPQFLVNLRSLTAKSAPGLAWLMQSKIEAARLKAASEVTRSKRLMDQELRSRQPLTDFPPVTAHPETPAIPVPSSPRNAPSNTLASALAESKKRAEQDAHRALDQYESAVSQDQGHTPKMPNIAKMPNTPRIPDVPKMPDIPQTPNTARVPDLPNNQVVVPPNRPASLPSEAVPSLPKSSTTATELQMAQELAKARLLASSKSDVNASLERARKNTQAAVRQAEPVMGIISTRLRLTPNPRVPTTTEVLTATAPEADAQTIIQWDAWHAKFANLARNPILQTLAKGGNPEGANTVEITVWPNHHLAVRVTTPSNVVFDKAIVKAYRTLDGNPSLVYPPGSRRTAVTFLIDNKHVGAGTPSGVKSETSIGDREILHHHQ